MTTKNWHFWLTFLVCVSLSLTLVTNAGAAGEPQTSTYRYLETSKLTQELDLLEVGNGDTLYGLIVDDLKRSTDFGASWATVKTFGRGTSNTGLFVDSKGRVYVGRKATGIVHRGLVDGDSLAFTDVLTMQCDTGSGTWWNMTECAAGSLYVGNYAGTVDEHCAAIYRSSTGAHWTEVYYTPDQNRHIHEVGNDPWNDKVYASIGDTPLATARIISSADHGATWDTVRVGNALCKPISLAFTPTRRIWGSDVGAAGAALDSTNVVEWTNDDSAYTAGLRLTGDLDNYVWSMTQDADRTIFAGTFSGADDHDYGYIYSSRDSGSTWYTVETFPTANMWNGCKWMSDDCDSEGYGYYTIIEPDGLGVDTYRFREAPLWTVGAGGEFADVATALADFRVDAGDTLVMLANGGAAHVTEDDAMLANMTVRGATQDASLYLVKNGAADASGFTVGAAGVTFKDLTFRTLTEITTSGKSMIEVTDGGQITVDRCAFRNCDGNTAPGISLVGTGEGTTTATLTDCIADSCSGDTAEAFTAGFFQALDADAVTIDGLVASNCSSAGRGGAVRFTDNVGAVLVKNSLFVDNTSVDDGAALYIDGIVNTNTHKVWHCTFDGNEGTDIDQGQLLIRQVQCNLVVSHCIFTNSGTTYAMGVGGWPDSLRHCNSYNTGEDFMGWNAPVCTDTIHIDPNYSSTETSVAPAWTAKAKGCRDAADGGYMGWRHYIPDPFPVGHKRTPSRRRR